MASGLRQRVLTALVLAALVVGLLLVFPPVAAVAAIHLVVLAGAWEWAGFARLVTPPARALYTAAVGVACWVAWRVSADPAGLDLVLRLAALWWLAGFLWLLLAPGRGGPVAAALAGFLVLVPAAVGFGRLVTAEPGGRLLMLFLLALIAAADVGAYFGGRRYGRHKLAPRVSPGKTWEGFAAGMLGAAAVAALTAPVFGRPLLPWLALGVLVALLSVVGDLVESLFKRRAGLKDSSGLLPGHGGVMDRIDSLTAAGPVFLLGLGSLGLPA